MYFAIEGIKGSGKSAVFAGVYTELQYQGFEPHRLSPTSARPANILDALHVVSGRYWPDFLTERLYAARSNRAARQVPKRGLVLGERSVFTSYVSRWNHADPAATLVRVDALEHHIQLPQHVLYLSVPVELAVKRIDSRPRRAYGNRDQTSTRLREADAVYRHLACMGQCYGIDQVQWHWVDATKPLFEVVRNTTEIIAALQPHPMRTTPVGGSNSHPQAIGEQE